MTGDDETLDDLEELLDQVREPEPTAGPASDETIPAAEPAGDETIPAAEPALGGADDNTIDVDPEMIRRLRDQSPPLDATIPRPALPTQQPAPPTEPPPKRNKRRRPVADVLAIAAAAAAVLIALGVWWPESALHLVGLLVAAAVLIALVVRMLIALVVRISGMRFRLGPKRSAGR